MRSSSSLEPAPLLAPRLRPRVLSLALQLDPVAVGEQLDRLGEAEPLLLLDELDRVAADPAAEAVVELLLGVDRERRRALLVERAEADPAGALAAQVGVGGDHLDDVGRLLDPLQALGRRSAPWAHRSAARWLRTSPPRGSSARRTWRCRSDRSSRRGSRRRAGTRPPPAPPPAPPRGAPCSGRRGRAGCGAPARARGAPSPR